MENLEIGGLQIKCDTLNCEYMRKIDETKVKEFIGLKCPKCDAVLITQAEVDALNGFSEFVTAVNDISKEAGFIATEENQEQINVSIKAPRDKEKPNDKEESRPDRNKRKS